MFKPIDALLNGFTMYRVVLYGLIILTVIALLFGAIGWLPFTLSQLLLTLLLVLVSCWFTNWGLAKIVHAATNTESFLITGLILFFILAPIANSQDMWVTIAAGVLAMASKYVLAIDKKHLFNPAAVAMFVLGLFGFGNSIWWAGSGVLLPFVSIIGFLIVRKIRRFQLFFSFITVALLTTVFLNTTRNHMTLYDIVVQVFTSWPLIFFGTVMLTEPLTTPPRKHLRIIYGALVGLLFGSQFEIGPLFSTPEFALVAGNIFSYTVGPKHILFLHLKEKMQLGPMLYQFVFTKHPGFSFLPGQYLEWTMPGLGGDSRGNRRYFTIASSPTEETLKLGVRIDTEHASAFKHRLLSLTPGEKVVANHVSGDFVLPQDPIKKLVFIAGGIGVTPFRSMCQYLLDSHQKRDIVFFYTASTEGELVYRDIFDAAQKIGIQMVYVITKVEQVPPLWKGEKGRITPEMIRRFVPDYTDRLFYLSGPVSMVDAYKSLLVHLGVKGGNIRTDYFPGF